MRPSYPVFAALSVLVASGLAHAEDAKAGIRIDAVDVVPTDDGAEITIRGDQRPEYSLFKLSSPTRVVIDMPGADVAATKVPSNSPADALVASVTTTQFRGRTGPVARVVLVLRGDVELEAKQAARAVVLVARRAAAAAPASPVAVTTSAPTSASPVIEITGSEETATARHLLGVEARSHDGGTVVQLRTDGEVARYEVEEAVAPARLVVSLYGVSSTAGADRAFEQTAIRAARIGKRDDHVRVVLDMRADGAMPHYDVASTGEGLAIVFSTTAEAKTAAVEVGGVSFDRKNGFWRLRLDTGAPVTVRTVKNAPDEKVVALDGARVPQRLLGARGLRGGPVVDVVLAHDDVRADSARVKLVVVGDVEHSVWQKDGSVYWDVRAREATVARSDDRVQPAAAPFSTAPITVAQQGLAAAAYRGKKVTIDLQDADIVNVIRLIGDVSGKNVVVAEDVKGKVTLKLKNVPWDQALDVTLKTKDLGQETRGGIIRVVLQSKLDAERQARLALQEEREKKMPTTVRLIPVNYAVAKELQPQVKEILSARGKVAFDERTNVLVVEDIRDNLDQAERLVRTLDTQTPQVLIEARMVEGSTTFTRTLGIQWGGGLFFSQRGGNPTGLVFPNNVGVVGGADDVTAIQSGTATPGVAFPPNFAVNLPAQNVTSSIGLNLGSIGNFGFLNARLSAAESAGQAKIISAPRVTTLNNKRARITQGVDITIPVVTANTLTVQVVKAALTLDVTPHVTADGSILMALNIQNDVPDFAQRTRDIPAIQTKQAETEMLVPDGDTAVIGGIFTRTQGENTQQTPFLGSIPLLGWLFKSYTENDNRTEMLVFITPRIVNRGVGGGAQ
ncbi:MAG: type IV pilus secretin PilQ [Deltaproteobacteria bacterium]|nr:type IV pilus secretin PilQ [Deltaproteobacteria bacterium]